MTAAPFSVCVYCGSRDGTRPEYGQAAQACGQYIGQQGWQLVYGGGHSGMMGQVADAALAAGAQVVGVIPEKLMVREQAHKGVTQLHVVANMHDRKKVMADNADAFVALPGGIGTLEELFEIWTWYQLGYHQKLLGLLNVAGYFDDLIRFIDRSQADGFLWPDVQQMLLIDTDIDRLLNRLHAQAAQLGLAAAPSDLSQT